MVRWSISLGRRECLFLVGLSLNNFVDLMQYRLLLDLRHSGTGMLIIFRQVYSYIWHTYNNRDGCSRSRFICVRQKPSSPRLFPPAEVRRNLEDLGDYLFNFRQKKSSPSTEEYIRERWKTSICPSSSTC